MIAAFAVFLFASPCDPWPLWSRYLERFVSGDGRIIDRTAADRTTSEGQAYALFFSLVANDRAQFERLLTWTVQNLARGDLGRSLPAWHWGKRRDGSWGVIDSNPASDADLWIAYALLEAGRLWREPRYQDLGRNVLRNVAAREVVSAPPLGPILLPGPVGFAFDGGYRVNPSYAPPPLLQRFSAEGAPWPAVKDSSMRMLQVFARRGAAPDWAFVKRGGPLAPDPRHGRTASYDAIRVPLWVGIAPARDPGLDAVASGLLAAFDRTGKLPEKIDALTLQGRGEAPPGFYGALLPIAPEKIRPTLEARLAAALHGGLYGEPPAYFDQNLILFAQGFLEGRYRFAPDGSLAPAWESRCLGRAR